MTPPDPNPPGGPTRRPSGPGRLPRPEELGPGPGPVFTKHRADAPPGFFAAEAAGLDWLADAEQDGGVPALRPLALAPNRIVLPRLASTAPTRAAAEEFGRRLASTHRAGAPHVGCPPPGAPAEGFIGPLPLPYARLPHTRPGNDPDRGTPNDRAPGMADSGTNTPGTNTPGADVFDSHVADSHTSDSHTSDSHAPGTDVPGTVTGAAADWGTFYAVLRVLPYAHRAARDGSLTPAGLRTVERVCERLRAGDARLTGPDEPVARLHGDLWSGNVLWTASGAVLIDPAAHGGHRETDLAMLALFGLPHLDRVLAAYQEVWPLAPGWQHRVGLHQLHPLLVHAALFGSGYGAQAASVAARYG
jgi:fructosamine-3-kinase